MGETKREIGIVEDTTRWRGWYQLTIAHNTDDREMTKDCSNNRSRASTTGATIAHTCKPPTTNAADVTRSDSISSSGFCTLLTRPNFFFCKAPKGVELQQHNDTSKKKVIAFTWHNTQRMITNHSEEMPHNTPL